MRVAVTGGAGFIGSHFVDKCVEEGWDVRVVDNFRTGRMEFVNEQAWRPWDDVLNTQKVDIVESSMSKLYKAFDGCDWVAHFAANADVRYGFDRPFFDIEQNIIGTHRVLEAMRGVGVKNIFFASTASVYGSLSLPVIPEDAPMPVQNSLYGTSKLAAEGLISSYVEKFGFNSVIGRWVQIMGERYLHGHVIDFVRKLQRDETKLHILGSGTQRKSGLYVKDLCAGIFAAMEWAGIDKNFHNVFNFGTSSTFSVFESADIICELMGVSPRYVPEIGIADPRGGWVGDNPSVLLDSSHAKRVLGWQAETSVQDAIIKTVDWLLSDECGYL